MNVKFFLVLMIFTTTALNGMNERPGTERFIEALDLGCLHFSKRGSANPFTDPVLSNGALFSRATVLRTMPAMPSSLQEKITEAITSLNTKFPCIRILLAASPGLGHQSSSLEVARRLRVLGYTGKLEIFSVGDVQRYRAITDDFFTEMRRYPYPCSLVNSEEIKETECGLGITGGYDFPGKSYEKEGAEFGHQSSSAQFVLETDQLTKLCNCRIVLCLQPYQWVMPSSPRAIIEKDVPIFALPELNKQTLAHLYEESALSYPFIRIPVLAKIINQLRAGRLHLMLVYQLLSRSNYQQVINMLIEAIAQVKSTKLQHPVIILFVDSTGGPTTLPDERLTNGLGLCKISETAVFDSICREHATIITCFSEALPTKVFRNLLALSDLPPVFEGANTTNQHLALALQGAIPASISYRDSATPFLPTFDEKNDACQSQCHFLSSQLTPEVLSSTASAETKEGIRNALTDFIHKALDPYSALNQYFLCCARRCMLPCNDLTTIGILSLMKHLKNKDRAAMPHVKRPKLIDLTLANSLTDIL